MDINVGLVTGSHNTNELVVIRHRHEFSGSDEYQKLNGEACLICGDGVGFTVDGEVFVACNECAFPICKTCYEYERSEGNQACPQCQTRFKRLKNFPRVPGDEDEDDVDDIENEFNITCRDMIVEHHEDTVFHSCSSLGWATDTSQVLLLTDGCTVDHISPEQHALVDSSLTDFKHEYSFDSSKDFSSISFGSFSWKERMKNWTNQQASRQTTKHGKGSRHWDDNGDEPVLPLIDEARLPLSRKIPIPSSQINPYRMIIIVRLVVLGFFFHYRITHPVEDAHAIWLVSVICEIWFSISWILDQFPKCFPIDRETYLDRLSLRYEKEGEPSELAPVDIFVTTVDPLKEPTLITANTILSILAVDYPVDKVTCYVSDDGASILTFEALLETLEFARKWVPFCKTFNIEPRAPELYFAEKMDYWKEKVFPAFVKERRYMKREYEEFKVRINVLVAKAQRVPDGGWIMQDGTPWPGNNVRDHPGMIQVFHKEIGEHDVDGNELSRLIYVSREKNPGFNCHRKAGAMNALVRVSAILTNAPYILHLDCDQYINNSKALREAMCFMMDPLIGKNVCYVQFPQRFDGIDRHNRHATWNNVSVESNMRGLDGIQGPMYVGTGCVFRRQAFYGHDAPKSLYACRRICHCWSSWFSPRTGKEGKLGTTTNKTNESSKENDRRAERFTETEGNEVISDQRSIEVWDHKLRKKFGQSHVFAASTLLNDGGTQQDTDFASVFKESIHALSCGYEEKTDWGKEVGWIYGSEREDILTGFKMHCHGWRSLYCSPSRPAFTSSRTINLFDCLHKEHQRAVGSVEIFFSRHCPLWYGYGSHLKRLQHLFYINATIFPWSSIPLVVYCTLPAVCLLTGKFIIAELTEGASMLFVSLFICIFATSMLETRWSGVGIRDWWKNQQIWVIAGVSAHLFAVFQGLVKVVTGLNIKWTAILIPPTTLLILNIIGVFAGISEEIAKDDESWGLLFGKLFFALWFIVQLYPFLKGLLGRRNRMPTIVFVWSILLASVFSLLWVRLNPFRRESGEPVLEECRLDCI